MSQTQASSDAFSKRVVLVVVLAYVAMMVTLGVLGYVGFVFKTMIIPVLLVVALITRSLTPFFKDWFVYLALTLLFDSLRGYIWVLIKEFELPFFMGYAISAEKALLGGTTFPHLLQDLFYTPGTIGPLDIACSVVYASHFLAFFLFGLVVWYWRREEFWRYRVAMVIVMYVGGALYLLVPTVPPWMAGNVFRVMPFVYQPGREVYNVAFPTLVETFASNPIAAMPSLHAAFPTACATLAVWLFGRKGLVLVPYALAVFFAAGYLGEHYIVDLFAGVGLGLMACAATKLAPKLERVRLAPVEDSSAQLAFSQSPLLRSALVGATFIAFAYGISELSIILNKPFVPSLAFVNRELVGRSPMGSYYLGWVSHDKGDFETARVATERALAELPPENKRALVYANYFLARSAHFTNHHEEAVRAFRNVPESIYDAELAGLFAVSLLETGNDGEGFALLREVSEREPMNPTWDFALAKYGFLHGRSGPVEVESTIRRLEASPAQPQGAEYALALRSMLSGGRPL